MPSTYRVRKGEPLRLRPAVGVRLEKGSAIVTLDDEDVALVVGEYKLCGGAAVTLRTDERAQVLVEYIDEAAKQEQGNADYIKEKSEANADLSPGDGNYLFRLADASSAAAVEGKADLTEPGGVLVESQLPDSVVSRSAAEEPKGRHFVKRKRDNSGYEEAEDPVVNLLDFEADPSGSSSSTDAIEAAQTEGLPEHGGVILAPAGWYVSNNAVILKPNVEIRTIGAPGSGISGVFAAKSFSGTVFAADEEGAIPLILGPATGGTEYRGTTIQGVAFADGTASHKGSPAGVLIRNMAYVNFLNCTWLFFEEGATVEQEGAASEYNFMLNPTMMGCKRGITQLGPDLVVVGGRLRGTKNSAEGPIAGSIGIEPSNDCRMLGTSIQAFETDGIIQGSNCDISVRLETVATWTTKAKKGLVISGNENRVKASLVNNASYSEKALTVTGNGNSVETPLPSSRIADEGLRNTFIGPEFTKMGGSKLGVFGSAPVVQPTLETGGAPGHVSLASKLVSLGLLKTTEAVESSAAVASANTMTIPAGVPYIEVSGTTEIKKITSTTAGHLVVLKFGASVTVKNGENLKLKEDFAATSNDTLTLMCAGANWFEVARQVI